MNQTINLSLTGLLRGPEENHTTIIVNSCSPSSRLPSNLSISLPCLPSPNLTNGHFRPLPLSRDLSLLPAAHPSPLHLALLLLSINDLFHFRKKQEWDQNYHNLLLSNQQSTLATSTSTHSFLPLTMKECLSCLRLIECPVSWPPALLGCAVLSRFSRVRLYATPGTVACQASLPMGFSRQEYWSELPCPPPGDLPDPGIEPTSLRSPALAGGFFTTSTTWEALQGSGSQSVAPD